MFQVPICSKPFSTIFRRDANDSQTIRHFNVAKSGIRHLAFQSWRWMLAKPRRPVKKPRSDARKASLFLRHQVKKSWFFKFFHLGYSNPKYVELLQDLGLKHDVKNHWCLLAARTGSAWGLGGAFQKWTEHAVRFKSCIQLNDYQ